MILSEFLKTENITEGETRQTSTHQKLEVLVRVDKTNFAEGKRQCSYKLGPGQETMQRLGQQKGGSHTGT